MLLTSPVTYNGDDKGTLKSMTLQKFTLGEPDESGRRSPIPIKGSEYEMEIDTVVVNRIRSEPPGAKDNTRTYPD